MAINKFLLFTLMVSLFLSACERTTELLDENNKWNYVDSSQNGNLKVVHAYASTSPAVVSGTGPKVMIYMDTTRILRDSLAYNATFPAPSGAYSVIPAGNHTFRYILSRSSISPLAGDTVFNASLNVTAGSKYTTFLVDSSQSPGALTVEDKWAPPTIGNYQIRFANLVPNPIDRYDVYADSVGKMVATNIGYREVSSFISVPVASGTESFTVRKTGTTTVVYTLTGFSGTSERVYTLYTRGRAGTTGRTPGLTFYTNR